MGSVYAVGVGPGSPRYITGVVQDIISRCDVVVGYHYTMQTIQHLVSDKETFFVTMTNQEEVYMNVARTLNNKTLVVPFTGDVNFSESEVVDRLVEIFGDVILIPGISSVQVAAAMARIPLDKCDVITMHVSGDIENKKCRMLQALHGGKSVILVPRPWPSRPDLEFMPSDIAAYLTKNQTDTGTLRMCVYENLTTSQQKETCGVVSDFLGSSFSDMLVVILDQNTPDPYTNYTDA